MIEYEHFKSMLQSAIKEMISDGTIRFDLRRTYTGFGPAIELSVEVDDQRTTYYPVRLE